MGEDASLDEFLDAGSSESAGESDTDDKPATSGEDTDTGSTTTDDVDPATTTYAWSGEGADCEACGAVVERRWHQDGTLVCVSCKEW